MKTAHERLAEGITVVGDWKDNPDGSSTVQLDITDDAALAWEEIYNQRISEGFETWFNEIINNLLKEKGY